MAAVALCSRTRMQDTASGGDMVLALVEMGASAAAMAACGPAAGGTLSGGGRRAVGGVEDKRQRHDPATMSGNRLSCSRSPASR